MPSFHRAVIKSTRHVERLVQMLDPHACTLQGSCQARLQLGSRDRRSPPCQATSAKCHPHRRSAPNPCKHNMASAGSASGDEVIKLSQHRQGLDLDLPPWDDKLDISTSEAGRVRHTILPSPKTEHSFARRRQAIICTLAHAAAKKKKGPRLRPLHSKAALRPLRSCG